MLCTAHIAGVLPGGAGKGAFRNREAAPGAGAGTMMQQFDQMQKLGKDNIDATMTAVGTVQKSVQAIAVEAADYAKRSFEQGSATLEKLAGARTLDKAVEIQTDYLRQAYEGFVAQSTKMGELYASVARETFKPFEGVAARTTVSAAR